MRLGDLLTQAGLLKAKDLREAMIIAKQQSLPVGRVLIMAQFISEPNLQSAVQCQSMLKDGHLDIDTAVNALKLASQKSIGLEEALAELGWSDKNDLLTNKLGEFLIEAELLSQEQLQIGLNEANNSKLPLGRVLVSMGTLSEQILSSALNAQILVRDGKIAREQAVQGLKACRDRQISIEQSLSESGLQLPSQESVRLGELLVMAKLLKEDKLMSAVELGLVEEKPIGQVMVEAGYISQENLDRALTVQRGVAAGKVKKSDCGQVLTKMAKGNLDLEEAIKASQPATQPSRELPLYQFLQLSGIITAKDIEEALKQGSRNTELMGQMLLLTEAIDEHLLNCACRLNDMMTQGLLNAEQSILAMGLCQNRNCSVEDAFKSLGWTAELDSNDSSETIPPNKVFATPLTTMGYGHTEPPKYEGTATGEQAAYQVETQQGITEINEDQMEQNLSATADVPPINIELTKTHDDDDDDDKKSRKRLADLMP
ncbi:MAG: hypothetical protein AB7W16_04460 [Candidatus Obscuribacterales bacterium]